MGLTRREPCPVAIVGAGRMAREHIRAFADVPGASVAGIHSRTRARAEALAHELGIPLVCSSLEELQERTRARLVVVTVTETATLEVALRSLTYPWVVALEKPPGLSLREAEQILGEAVRCGRDVRVCLNRQFLASTQQVLRQLREHAGPRFVKVQDQQNLAQARSLGHSPDVVARWPYANSIHLLDYFRLLARGAVAEVEPVFPWNPSAPGVVVARFRFDSGDVGVYEALWHAPGPWAASVSVEGRRWDLRPLEQATMQVLGQPAQSLAGDPRDTAFKPGFRLQAEKAVAAAAGEPSELPTIAEALETMKLVAAVYGE